MKFCFLLTLLVFNLFSVSAATRNISTTYDQAALHLQYGGNLPRAVLDIVEGIPIKQLTIVFDNHTDVNLIYELIQNLMQHSITVKFFNVTTPELQDQYFSSLAQVYKNYIDETAIFFCNHRVYEHLLIEIYEYNYIRRNLLFIFYWGSKPVDRYFIRSMHEVMKICLITNPRKNTYRLYYNQATSHRRHHLVMVNWWNPAAKLFHHPTLPNARKVYTNFHGKMFYVPVLNKPPWHFVEYVNGSIEVLGGRDHKLLHLLAERLNFRFEYFDPPDRTQGTTFSANSTFGGTLGLVWRREADLFIGDVTLTLERFSAVEFSFLTLADSGAFVTHAPNRLNEALALVRPFHWQVWPAIILTLIVSGPILYALIALPNFWEPRFIVRSHVKLLLDCYWCTTTLFLKQTGRDPSHSHKARFFIIILSLSATYVIADMYSANLTSLLARPGREKPVHNLAQLEFSMLTKGYRLYVEKHSSSYSLLENGTGIYGRLWDIMTKRQPTFLTDTVEDGVLMVKNIPNIAVIAGRETLFFDIQRFGANHFHLSEKLNTAYSAIAFQIGCPYIENVNYVLMAIFEAGILTRMTEGEYSKLGQQQKKANLQPAGILAHSGAKENPRLAKPEKRNEKLEPINIKMLQGAFYLLFIGNAFSGLVFILEIMYFRQLMNYRRTRHKRCIVLKRIRKKLVYLISHIASYIRRRYQEILHDAFVDTLEYIH